MSNTDKQDDGLAWCTNHPYAQFVQLTQGAAPHGYIFPWSATEQEATRRAQLFQDLITHHAAEYRLEDSEQWTPMEHFHNGTRCGATNDAGETACLCC